MSTAFDGETVNGGESESQRPFAPPPRGGHHPHQPRGMDTALAKQMPSLHGLTKENYRRVRKKIQLFAKACARRGVEAVAEGALALFQSFEGLAWNACEEMDLDLLDRSTAFDAILARLDTPFQYDEDDEKPARIEELVSQFNRLKNETLRDYILRFENLQARLSEVKLVMPDELMGYFLLFRAGIPKHQVPNIKSHTGKKLSKDAVQKALFEMFGPDSKPAHRDLGRHGKDTENVDYFEDNGAYYEDSYSIDDYSEYQNDDIFYGEEDSYEYDSYYGEEFYDDDSYYEDSYEASEVPPELDAAADASEEAYANWIETRKKMKEMALSRGSNRSSR